MKNFDAFVDMFWNNYCEPSVAKNWLHMMAVRTVATIYRVKLILYIIANRDTATKCSQFGYAGV